ncbi:hypothetical protein EYZ11_008019 [Aspergillus tanneri]|uniref:Ketoreductase (KR) domain-containing protein n=1 Tax=Aspergillus tanneri TaxID=1220188 RepID=A0A4S3JDQ7_9EURO|nr:hypothetical protein EYZ11_008019 [Aspergillus tanneri]
MATALVGTAIVTGANGSLGSEIAIAIAKAQPFVHLMLLARDIRSDSVKDLTSRLRLIGPRSVEVLRVDLASFNSVVSFAENTVERVQSKEIPPVTVLINSAATSSYMTDQTTRDGYDPVYQTNCIAPFLLTETLLEAFRAGDGTPNGGARVINIGCSSMSKGSLDYFEKHPTASDANQPPGTPMSAKDGAIRYGSSKLIMSAAMYALRRSLVLFEWYTKPGLDSRDTVENWGRERYYILNGEYEAGSVIPVLRDSPQMDELLKKVMRQVEIGVKGMGSPQSRISRLTAR